MAETSKRFCFQAQLVMNLGLFVWLALTFGPALWAQSTAILKGTVTDSGSVFPGPSSKM